MRALGQAQRPLLTCVASRLAPLEGLRTDVILLAHSMGGLLTAETVLLRQADSKGTGALRHRIVGTICFDTPFLGMDLGVIKAGLGSIFRPGPAFPQPPQSNSEGMSTVFDRFFNEAYQNDVLSPVRSTWESTQHFVTKHSQDLRDATKRLIMSHLEFGSCMLDYEGLKKRYGTVRILEDEEESTRKFAVETRPPPRVRFANYYTASTGRIKPVKVPNPAKIGAQAPNAVEGLDTSREPVDNASPKPMSKRVMSSTSSIAQTTTVKGGPSRSNSYQSSGAGSTLPFLNMLDPTPAEESNSYSFADSKGGAVHDLMSAPSSNMSALTLQSSSNVSEFTLQSSSSFGTNSTQNPVLGGKAFKAAIKAQEAVIKARKAALEPNYKATEARLKAEFTIAEAQIKTEHAADKKARKAALEALKTERKAAEEAAKLEYKKDIEDVKASIEALKNEGKNPKEAEKLVQKAEKNAAKDDGSTSKDGPKPENMTDNATKDEVKSPKEAAKAAQKAEKEAAKAAKEAEKEAVKANKEAEKLRVKTEREEAKLKREEHKVMLKNVREVDKQSRADAKALAEQERPKKDRHFCILPPADNAGNRDPTWIRVYMPGVDEVGAHCGLFFPTNAGAADAAEKAKPGTATAAQGTGLEPPSPSVTGQQRTSVQTPPAPSQPGAYSAMDSQSSSGSSSRSSSISDPSLTTTGTAAEMAQAMGRRNHWAGRYSNLVGDVAGRIEGWVIESAVE